jgi:hypothetical protein
MHGCSRWNEDLCLAGVCALGMQQWPWVIYTSSILCTVSKQLFLFITSRTIIPYQPSYLNLSGAFAKPSPSTKSYRILRAVVTVKPLAYTISTIPNLIIFAVSVSVASLKNHLTLSTSKGWSPVVPKVSKTCLHSSISWNHISTLMRISDAGNE